jgi:hypothetical protein
LKDHRRIGWQLIDLIGPLDGLLTKNWETDLLKYLKSKGAIFSAQKNVGKFSGHTESWIEESYKANSLKELMNLVRSEE